MGHDKIRMLCKYVHYKTVLNYTTKSTLYEHNVLCGCVNKKRNMTPFRQLKKKETSPNNTLTLLCNA